MSATIARSDQGRLGEQASLIVIAVLVGVAGAVQARINGELSATMQSATQAAAISFAVGMVLILIVAAARSDARDGLRRIVSGITSRMLPWWGLLGGLCGAAVVFTQTLSVPVIGVSVFTTALLVGQLCGSLAVDQFGWMRSPRVQFSWLRVVGAAIAIGAVFVIGFGSGMQVESLWLITAAAAGGVLLSLQLGLSGTVRHHARDSISPTLLNFTTGFVVLFAVSVVGGMFWPGELRLPSTWWHYLGGAIGIGCFFLMVTVVRQLGVLIMSLSLIGGQLLGSLAIDVFYGEVDRFVVMGVALSFLGITVAHVAMRRVAPAREQTAALRDPA